MNRTYMGLLSISLADNANRLSHLALVTNDVWLAKGIVVIVRDNASLADIANRLM